MAGVPVLGVSREGASAVHLLPQPLEEGAEVEMEVDWERRFDHMQQHSGGCDSSPPPPHPHYPALTNQQRSIS